MRFGTLARSAVVLLPLLVVCAARLHAQRTAAPDRMTQEVNRCLTVMRVAAARRKSTSDSRVAAPSARTDGAPSWAPRPGRNERTA